MKKFRLKIDRNFLDFKLMNVESTGCVTLVFKRSLLRILSSGLIPLLNNIFPLSS